MRISIVDARKKLSALVDEAAKNSVVITRRDKEVAVLISLDEYERLIKAQAFLRKVQMSRQLRDRGLTAKELCKESRQELP